MMKKIVFSLLAAALCLPAAKAFSPYENYLQSGRPTHVMLAAAVLPEKTNALYTALRAAVADPAARRAGLTNFAVFSRKLGEKQCVFVYFDYPGDRDYLDAVEDFEKLPGVKALSAFIKPIPPAADRGHTWLQLEWINFIRGSLNDGPATNRFAMVTRIKPKDEDHYRSLHQTTWPGIIDWMNRKGWRNFSIFFAEIDGALYEFYYTEEVPSEHPATNLDKDPCLLRWLNLTAPCQDPLPDAQGTWSPMKAVLK